MFELAREWRFYLTDMISFAEKVQVLRMISTRYALKPVA